MAESRPKFRVGQRVRCNDPGSWVHERFGVIERLDVVAPDGIEGHQVRVEAPGDRTRPLGVTVLPPECLMAVQRVANTEFSPREGETLTLLESRPSSGRWFAVLARSCQMPEGEREPTAGSGAAVAMAALVAAEVNAEGRWQWLHLSSAAKDLLAEWMMASDGVVRDRWYYVTVE